MPGKSVVTPPLITEAQLDARVRAMAGEIVASYGDGASLTIVAILNGAVVFLADLIRRMPVDLEFGLIAVSSYPGAATEPVAARVTRQLAVDVAGRDVLIVDDILDTGGTLRLVQDELRRRGPRSVKTAVLLRKQGKQSATPGAAAATADFIGFDVPDVWVVGYGLDFDNRFRNLPYIAELRCA